VRGSPWLLRNEEAAVQILFAFGQNGYLLGFTNKAIYQGSLKEYCTPTLNCYACPGALFACPIGSLQHFIIVGQAIPAYVMGYLAAIGAVVGRCAAAGSALRFFQDLLYKVRSVKIAIPKALTYFSTSCSPGWSSRSRSSTRNPGSPSSARTAS
jgi:ferredoxin-type protein NapH